MNQARMTTSALGAALVMGWLAVGCAVDATDGTSAPANEETGQAEQPFGYGVYGKFYAYGGRCLDLRGGLAGNPVQIYNCGSGANQLWTFANPNGPVFSDTAYAIGMKEDNTGVNSGVSALAWGAGPSSARWTMPSAEILSDATHCLSWVASDNQVVIDTCGNGGTSWIFDESSTPIRTHHNDGHPELCLEAGGTTSGSNLFTHTCTGAANQSWTLVGGGTIKQGGLCVDIRSGVGLGHFAQLYSCNGGSNQKFSLSGQLSNSESGHCLSLQSTGGIPNTNNGSAVVMDTCTADGWKSWKYSW
jgi:hypothetical protein